MDPPQHARYRRLLTGQFTVRRMNQLRPRIERTVEEHLDAMEEAGSPVDLVQAFAMPIPSLVICELLGVPYADRSKFRAVANDLQASDEEASAAMRSLADFIGELIRRKHAEPADDLLSGLIGSGELTDDEIAGIAMLLLLAGHDSTANMLALGTFALLAHPDQLEDLRTGVTSIDNAVEELLRYLTILQHGTNRTSLEDVELDGQLIKAGESVTISVSAANRDPARFQDPDQLNLSREASGHLAFGHGIHQCIGQQLARIEMRVGFVALFGRFPALRLAIPPEEVPLNHDNFVYGAHRLPVEW